jgi:hypothetical protein
MHKNTFMKLILLLILTCVIISCSTYTLTTQDLVTQFSDTIKYNRISCKDDKGDIVWLYLNAHTSLQILEKNQSKPLEFNIYSTRCSNDSLKGKLQNFRGTDRSISLDDISTISLKTIFPKESIFFNLDSCKKIVTEKNDSLDKICLSKNELAIYLVPINNNAPIKDSIGIFTNACYFINFTNSQIKRGVITKITEDSIYITNAFSKEVAIRSKIEFKVLKYRVDEITSIILYHESGIIANKLDRKDYKFITKEINSLDSYCSCWYVCDEFTGDIWLYRDELTAIGYVGVKEINGEVYW